MAFIHEHGMSVIMETEKITHCSDNLQGVHTLGPGKNFVYWHHYQKQ